MPYADKEFHFLFKIIEMKRKVQFTEQVIITAVRAIGSDKLITTRLIIARQCELCTSPQG